jgi:RNA polymerase sigma-B factor
MPRDPDAAAEVAALFREYRETGDREIRNRLVEAHASVAEFYVKRYQGRGVPADDLRQVGLLAIVRAVERFDPDMGVEFSTFASRTIEGECKRYFRDRTWSVRPPRRAQELHLALRRAEEDLVHRLGRSPTIAELADEVDDSIDHVIEAMEAGVAHQATSLDQPGPTSERQPAPMSDRLPSTDHDRYGDVESQLLVHGLLDQLDERERQIIHLRFFENRTQEEIAEEIGVSQSYLSRLLRRVLLDLRASLTEDAADERVRRS